MGSMVAAHDWSGTALGPIAGWGQSLRTAVGICLGSAHPMVIWWGPTLVLIYNDAWIPILGPNKHPALGRPGAAVWPENWHIVGEQMRGVLASGRATWSDDQLLPCDRNGYLEEAYFTYSYSPITDETGGVGGVFTAVTETTERVLGVRRLRVLRELGAISAVSAPTASAAAAAALAVLARARDDVPFAAVYLLEESRGVLTQAGFCGMVDDPRIVPPVLDRVGGARPAPSAGGLDLALRSVLDSGDAYVWSGLDKALPGLIEATDSAMGATVPHAAVALPLRAAGGGVPTGVLLAGVSPFRVLDDDYRQFLDLVAHQVSTAIADASAYQAQQGRAEALAELDRAKTEFFTGISHELRTPLTLLLGPAEDALADVVQPLPQRQRRRVATIARNGARLLQLVNTLLDFSRLESGRITPRFTPLALDRLTVELAAMFDSAAERAGLSLSIDAPPLPAPVYIDRDAWAKIVANLLANAIKYTLTGAITVTLRPGDDAAVLTVTDTGIGIAPADQARIFEPFYRVRGAPGRTYEGSGIGLAMVADLVGLHGGVVNLDSVPGQGSAFTVTIPFGSGHLPAEQVVRDGVSNARTAEAAGGYLGEVNRWLTPDTAASPAVAAAETDTTPPSGPADPDSAWARSGSSTARVLVVDDNADMRGYLVDLLAEDYQVDTAADGLLALAAARADPPDLIVTDVMMPNLDGFGLLAALRADPGTTGIPVVMLSARAGEDGIAVGLEAGADDYLVKPFTARELRARVRANLELDRSRRIRAELTQQRELLDEAQHVAQVGSWQLDLDSGAITGSKEYFRLLGVDPAEFASGGVPVALRYVHPDDVARAVAAIEAGAAGAEIDVELRVLPASGEMRLVRSLGGLHRGPDGCRVLRGTMQDITAEHRAEQTRLAAAAAREAAAREHHIAEQLQAGLLPATDFDPDYLRVGTFYRAGAAGTIVGGDWYDVIDVGAGRTALVIGDVMGRGVRAAAVMGQLRAAIRAYARLQLSPAQVLAYLDATVRELGQDQIVTCVYGVYDPGERLLTYANAGHPPPLLVEPGGPVRRLPGASSAPLGTGLVYPTEERVVLAPGAVLALYTDGLVERRGRDLDHGIEALAVELAAARTGTLGERIATISDKLLPAGPDDDDVAILLAQVPDDAAEAKAAALSLAGEARTVATARAFVTTTLTGWQVPPGLADDLVLLASELVTNAVLHTATVQVQVQLRATSAHLVLEVHDQAGGTPHPRHPGPQAEHGRGLQLVAALADAWGVRPHRGGKVIWCQFALQDRPATAAGTAARARASA